MDDTKQAKLAVLIDADNTQPSIAEPLLSEIAKYGVASVKRIYGDWTGSHLKSWKNELLEHAIQPIQQFRYTVGKNATDSAMIIDAMDLLYTEKLDGFCIVSSDSDFTRLSSRIREAGLAVYGFGEKKTPQPFVRACDKFIYNDILVKSDESPVPKKMPSQDMKKDTRLASVLRESVEDSADESGWAYLGNVGQNIVKKSPEFDPRNYGYKKLIDLVEAVGLFEILERSSENSPGKSIYVRDKRGRPRSR